MDPKELVKRFKIGTGKVVQFPHHPKVPTLLIHGRKYVLSDYWLMSEDIKDLGAKVIDVGKRYSYLWVFDTDRKFLVMWRVSDGDEKVAERASSLTHYIYTLEKKGQLNRVTHEEYLDIERFMRAKNEESFRKLKEWAAELSTEWEKEAKGILQDWFNRHLRPELDRRLAEVDQGVLPFGFRAKDHYLSPKEQARHFVLNDILSRFNRDKAYEIASKAAGFDAYDPPDGRDTQAVQWAWGDVMEEIWEQYKE